MLANYYNACGNNKLFGLNPRRVLLLSAGVKHIQAIFERIIKHGGFDRNIGRIKILEAGNGSLTGLLKVEKEDTNMGNKLHGGASAHLVDILSTAALLTYQNGPDTTVQNPGVSVQLNLSYLKGVSLGEEILIKCRTDKVGKRLAFLSVDILDNKSGDLIVKASHTKFIG